jgi:peptide/nickel transport system substrate-binding protein
MLRGFRWQLVALLTAASLFAISLLVRSTDTQVPPTATPAPDAEITAQATALPTEIPVQSPVIRAPNQDNDGVTTYREALVGNVQRLNPLFAAMNPVDRDITSLIFEGLTETNAYGEPQARLALDWTISSDGLEYTVRLREDILWQDGLPFNADDVVYTMSILRSPDFPGPAELGAFWRTVETEKLGDHLVRFRLTQPLGRFLDMLRIGILPAHALQGTGAAQLAAHPFNLSPIGTGPYQLEAVRVNGNTIVAVDLRVAPNYRQRPEGQTGYALDRLRFIMFGDFASAREALAQGRVDGLVAGERRERRPLLNIGGVVPYTQIQPDLGVIIFNWANPNTAFFREQRLRVALEVGVDRSSVVERNLLNEAVRADSPIMPGSWAYLSDLPWPPHNPGEARDLLARAYERAQETAAAEATEAPETTEEAIEESTEAPAAPSNILFSFEILAPDDEALARMAQEIATQWMQYGLGVTVVTADEATFQARLESGDFDAALVELSLGDSADPDVYEFWHEGQYENGKNYGGASDRRVSEALEKARQETSGVNRVVYYQQFQRDFVDRAIAIPMYYPLFTYAVADDVQGVQLGFIGTPADRFRNIRDWVLFRE